MNRKKKSIPRRQTRVNQEDGKSMFSNVSLRRLIRSAAILLFLLISINAFSQAPQRIEITAKRYSFDPASITLKKDVPVVLVLTSKDVTHGLEIKELGVNTKIPKDRTVEVPVTPQAVGTFRGKCSVFCGFGHRHMTMTVKVTE
jgi:cytochrome c oxidase subunit 2